eukprot:1474657-Amphidinium_carterae.2
MRALAATSPASTNATLGRQQQAPQGTLGGAFTIKDLWQVHVHGLGIQETSSAFLGHLFPIAAILHFKVLDKDNCTTRRGNTILQAVGDLV